MDRIGIIGAGLIGRAWAIVFARAGHPVALYDNSPTALQANLIVLEASLRDLDEHGLVPESPDQVRARITPVASLEEAVRGAAYVQENIGETLSAKHDVFAAMDALASPDCILASSTSTIPASAFTENLAGRGRCLVAHPIQPPFLIPLVEISPAPWTAPDRVQRTVSLLRDAGQLPIIVRREIHGFIVNRLQAALLSEALRLWEAGYASAEEIDMTVRDGLGMRWAFMGPIETFDLSSPGGVTDASARYGRLFLDINRSQVAKELSDESIARLAAERTSVLPRASLADRARWRDRRLMGLVSHKRQVSARDKSTGDEPNQGGEGQGN